MATGVQNAWSPTAADNDDADSLINWLEGQAPSTVNGSARAMMALVKKWVKDWQGGLVTGGSNTAYTLTTNEVIALADGVSVRCRINATSGATPTLNVDSTGAVAIQSVQGTAIPTGALIAGSIHKFTYYAASAAWVVNGVSSAPGSETLAGLLELATDAETQAGTDTARAITPANLAARTATETRTGIVELSTDAEAITGTDTGRVTTPANVKAVLDARAASDTVSGLAEIATQAEMETGTDTGRIVAPGLQHFHPAHPKCWAYVTVSGGTPTLQTSHNITGITDHGAGDITFTIATDFSSANWASLAQGALRSGGDFAVPTVGTGGKAAGTVRMTNGLSGVGGIDPENWSFAGFGDQA